MLPHAIIVLNALPDDGSSALWEIPAATDHFLESLSRTIYTNIKFKQYAEFWRARDRRIDTVEQLFSSYYSSVKVMSLNLTFCEHTIVCLGLNWLTFFEDSTDPDWGSTEVSRNADSRAAKQHI